MSSEFEFTLSSHDIISAIPGDVLILKYQQARKIKAGIYGASVIALDFVRINKVPRVILRIRWHSALGLRRPQEGYIILCEDGMVECPISGLSIGVRLPTEAEKKNHLERVVKDELKYG